MPKPHRVGRRAPAPFDPQSVQQQLHKGREGGNEHNGLIVKRYARLNGKGKPVRCAHEDGAPTYDTTQAAETARDELSEAFPTVRFIVAPCPHPGRRHVHIKRGAS